MRNLALIIFAAISLLVHVAAAALFISLPDHTMEEKGSGTASLEIGNLYDSAASEAVEPDTVEANEPAHKLLDPVKTRAAIPVKEFTHQDVPPTDVKPVAARVLDAPLLEELVATTEIAEPDILKPRATKVAKRHENKALEPIKATVAKPVERMEIKQVKQPVAAEIEHNSMPLPRPATKPKVRKPIKVAKAVKPVAEKKKAPRKPASKASKASRKGGEAANANGIKKATGGNGGKSKTANGKALVSNYKGKVQSKVRRAARRLRWPKGARNVPVTFVVAPSGALQSVRLGRSSGKSAFDAKLLKALGRAAPFGKFPAGMPSRPISFSVTFSNR